MAAVQTDSTGSEVWLALLLGYIRGYTNVKKKKNSLANKTFDLELKQKFLRFLKGIPVYTVPPIKKSFTKTKNAFSKREFITSREQA